MSASLSSTYLPENGPQNRVLMIGIAASVLVHVSILLLFPGLRQSAPASMGANHHYSDTVQSCRLASSRNHRTETPSGARNTQAGGEAAA